MAPITERGRNDQFALASDLHAHDAFIPPLDDLAQADRKIEGSAVSGGRVENLSVRQGADIVDGDRLPCLWRGAFADFQIYILEPRLGRDDLLFGGLGRF